MRARQTDFENVAWFVVTWHMKWRRTCISQILG